MSIPVAIKSVQYETIGPIVTKTSAAFTNYQYKTACTIFLDRGVAQPPVAEGVTGQTEEDQVIGYVIQSFAAEADYNQESAQNLAYQDALNQIAKYNFTITTSDNLGY